MLTDVWHIGDNAGRFPSTMPHMPAVLMKVIVLPLWERAMLEG